MTRPTGEAGYVPLAEVERNGFVEGVHFGSLVALNADGSIAFSYGDVDRPMHPRSANKLMQASGMREMGLSLSDELLALSAASHWGEPMHIDGVRRILASVGLHERSLQTTPDMPHDPAARRAAILSGSQPLSLFHGCSGKHASMIATCVINDWDPTDYLSPRHRLQEQLRERLQASVGETWTHTAIDGCGAPAWAISLCALAKAYRAGVLAAPGSSEHAVAAAMRAYPQFVAGSASEVTALMRAVPGALVKDGAEAVYAASMPDGRAVAVKVADGGFRAGQVALVAALDRLGLRELPGVNLAALDELSTVSVLGHGAAVGAVRPVFGRGAG